MLDSFMTKIGSIVVRDTNVISSFSAPHMVPGGAPCGGAGGDQGHDIVTVQSSHGTPGEVPYGNFYPSNYPYCV